MIDKNLQNFTENSEISTDQKRAIVCLLEEKTVSDAAKAAKVSRTTLHIWMKEPAFDAALKEAETELLNQAVRRLANGLSAALDTVTELNSSAFKESVRLRAAQVILERYFAAKQIADLEARLALLEERQKENER